MSIVKKNIRIGTVNYEKIANDYWEYICDDGTRFGCSTQTDLMLDHINELNEQLIQARGQSSNPNDIHRLNKFKNITYKALLNLNIRPWWHNNYQDSDGWDYSLCLGCKNTLYWGVANVNIKNTACL